MRGKGEAMPTTRTATRAAAVLLVVSALSACGRKDQPPAAEQAAPTTAAPAATTTTTTTLPPPPLVWRAAHFGMTRDEVLAAFPGEAQKLAKPAAFGPQDPATADVSIPSWEDGGVTWRVLFGFGASGLDRIRLVAAHPAATTCEDVEKALTDKGGAPVDRHETGTSLRGQEMSWRMPDQTVTLACAGVFSLGFATVTLDHRPPAAAAAIAPPPAAAASPGR
jgi:predicted small lipoprotein YifL